MTLLYQRISWIITAIAGTIVFAAFTAWGGIPADANAAAFWAQIAVFFLIICAFVLLLWHLLIRPLAPSLRNPTIDTLPTQLRQRIALILASGGIAIFVGGFWDELWHRSYGIPFGEDFFWRPHLLMYFGFGTTIVAGFWALLYLNRQLRGNFQQRFRSNIFISLLIANAAFLLYALPADPFWHLTFGQDLTAWSIPHLILLLSFVITLSIAIFIHVSTLGQREWASIANMKFGDAFTLVMIAALQLIWLQLMLIDWDAALAGIPLESLGLYRPEWLLGANLLASVTFSGVIVTRLLRRAGAATAAGLLALVIRLGMIQLFNAEMLQYVAWVAALLPLLAIDLWAYYSGVLRKQEPAWRGTAFAVIAAMAINLILIRDFYKLEDSDNLAFALAVVVTGIGMSWLSHRIADAMLKRLSVEAAEPGTSESMRSQLSFGIIGAFVAFIILFIATASPPV